LKLNEQFDVVYRYMLEGMDSDWSPFTKEGKGEYRNIPSGKYTFRVRAKGRNFLWSDEESISFVIHPPWWLTWWAYAFYIVSAVILLVLFLKINTYRLTQQKEQLEKTVNTRTAEVVQQKNEIELQAKTLSELNATKDKFFSIISHDLKGPINSLSSFIDLFQNHFDSLTQEEIKILINDVDNSQKNVAILLENLLSWALSQTGQIQYFPEEFDLTELLNENAEILKTQAKNKNLTLANTQSQVMLVSTHKNSIATVVRNLISNAIKYTPQNGEITYGWKKMSCEIIVTIEDTGVGMRPDIAENIFFIGAKSSNLGTANESGSGLGLILCKEFVEKNGGKIWVTSEANVGSKFMFSIPTQEKSKETSIT
jgi:signal transduction histidine kinase